MKKIMIGFFTFVMISSMITSIFSPMYSGNNEMTLALIKEDDTITASDVVDLYYSSKEGKKDFETYYKPIMNYFYEQEKYVNMMWIILPHYLNGIKPTKESVELLEQMIFTNQCHEDSEGNNICNYETVAIDSFIDQLLEIEIFNKNILDIDKNKLIQFFGMGFNPQDDGLGNIEHKANYFSEYYDKPFNPYSLSGWTGQCTWYAYARANEVNDKKFTDLPTTDARTWYAVAESRGYRVGQVPAKNSIVVWGGKHQHVAYVESYDGETITISEGNYGARGTMVQYTTLDYAIKFIKTNSGDFDWLVNRQSNGGGYFIGFIYLDDYE